MATKRNPNAPYWISIEQKEREIIEGALVATGGSVTRSASALGINRTHLTAIMKRLNMDRKSYLDPKVSP